VEVTVELADEGRVGVAQHDVHASLSENSEDIAEAILVIFGELPTGVSGEIARC